MQNYSILIVDDEPDVFDVLEGILFTQGYQLRYAANGLDALKFLKNNIPDLIILDLMMPDMDGMEVCRHIKENSAFKHIPIIMVTALSSKSVLADCMEAGADDFMSKPVNALEVRARVRSMLRLKQQHDELEKSNKALEQLLQIREDMAYSIVHDLRNPLAGILLASAVLQRTPLTEKQAQKVNQIVACQQRLQSLTDSLLLMAKLESGNLIPKLELLDISKIVQDTLAEFELQANSRKITIISQFPPAEVLIPVDEDLIQRVLENLLNNALKFSPEKSLITIQVEYDTERKTAKIRVIDQGKGVKDELKETILKRYEIGERFENVNQTGLGLAFCKMAIDAHAGDLLIEDNHPSGSIFTIELQAQNAA
jgi:two-component system sensor histidine kinase/response regulator